MPTGEAQNADDPGVELVREMLVAFGDRDVERVVSLTSPDCVIVALRSRLEGAFEGHDGVRKWVEGYYEIIPDAQGEIERIVKTGRNEVVALGRQTGTAPSGGTAFDAPLAALAQLEEGKLVRLVLFESHEEALAASGGAA